MMVRTKWQGNKMVKKEPLVISFAKNLIAN